MKRVIVLAAVLGVMGTGLVWSQQAGTAPATGPAATSTAPATQPTGAAALLGEMRKLLNTIPPPVRGDETATVAAIKQRAPEALKLLLDMEAKFPQAPELHEARLSVVNIVSEAARRSNDPAQAGKAVEVADRLLASDAPSELKLIADMQKVRLRIRPVGAASQPALPEAHQTIRDFADRYAKTDGAVEALGFAMRLAQIVQDAELNKELMQALVRDHADHPAVKLMIRQQQGHPDVGKPFKATLTKLDGTKLELPADMKGKVVVVDFWATWCTPCVAALPRLKHVYGKYHGKGVELVSISLDRTRDAAERFIKANQMPWVHVYEGGQSETAARYGIFAIPSLWVINREGIIVADDAEVDPEAKPEKLLATILDAVLEGKDAPTTAPAGKS